MISLEEILAGVGIKMEDLPADPVKGFAAIMKVGLAEEYATGWHRGQYRKYTGDPYIVHPRRVVARLQKVAPNDHVLHAAGWLHDVIEDTPITYAEIRRLFGAEIADLVLELTNPKDPNKNRAERKADEHKRFAKASPRAKTIKLADILDNLPSIQEHDPKFAKLYADEKLRLLSVLVEGDSALWDEAFEMVAKEFEK